MSMSMERLSGVLEQPQLSATAGASALEGYVVRRNEVPRSAPTPTLPTEADAETDKPVLLYRDTNAWCPYCERVTFALAEKDVPYDSVLIDLRAKPAWYKEIVPTELTPAAKINGELVWESMDILQRLEREFTEIPLLPSDSLRDEAEAVMGKAETLSGAGFRFIAGGSLATRPDDEKPGPASDDQLAEMRSAFEEHLAEFEQQLAKHEGPFLLGEFSLVDIVYAPAMERLAANLPVMRGFRLRDHPDYPHTAAWFQALDARPAYQKVKSDDTTHNLVFRKIFGVPLAATPAGSPAQAAARREAAAKIAANRTAIVYDLLKNSGIVRGRSNQYGNTLRAVNGYPMEPSPAAVAAVEYALRRLCSWLLHGTTGPRHPDLEAAALGSAALVFFAGRASSPRDLSAAACSELREGCWQLLKDMY
ncbi:g10516 [Coccomyxa elongata]